ncbi:MAG TPA: TetR family transcriptional regulator [Solirubrobacteraceae bacterium]|jgi:AcrR family transcriptional regulator|nr:TetR family transcriptional regulator [Solirubrobacteraceae bacterium]
MAASAQWRQSVLAGMPRGQLAEMQRARLLSAMVDAACELGYAQVTVADVIRRARVSRKTFYGLFDDRDDCMVAAFEGALAEGRALALDAYARESTWCDAVRSALAALLATMDQKPELAELLLVEVFAAGEKVMQRRAEVLAELALVVDRARTVDASRQPPAMTAEGIVGGVLAVLHKRVREASDESLASLLGPLMSMIVLPYLGPRAANRELARSVPAAEVPREQPRAARGDLLDGLDMRLTYRTMRALVAIAEQPGASNRDVARACGVVDQGQISKLLSRLERLALIENQGEGQRRGAPNAWYLTPRGIEFDKIAGVRPLLVV